ncbi:hypothetical protein HY251_02120 [bacterium]|nr:hypothetical protein [bacterium]
MSKKQTQERTKEEKRAHDVRMGLLIAHAVLAMLLVLGSQLDWWSVWVKGTLVETVLGREHDGIPARQAAVYMALSALIAFFFTTYDLVADADIQWPPLLVSAFALGCCTQQLYQTFYKDWEKIAESKISERMFDDSLKAVRSGDTAPETSSTGTVAPIVSAAAVDPASKYPFAIKLGTGLGLATTASLGMLLSSIYLTFFAKRKT